MDYSYYFCCYPMGRRETIEIIPKVLEEEGPVALSNELYYLDMNLGDSLTEGLEYSQKILADAFDGRTYNITDKLKYKHYPSSDNPLFDFVWSYIFNVEDSVQEVLSTAHTVHLYEDFINKCAKNHKLCSFDNLKNLCIENRLPLQGPNIVWFDFQEFIKYEAAHERPDTEELVDTLLNHFQIQESKREKLRYALPIYSDDFEGIMKVLQKLIDEEGIAEKHRFEYHMYKVTSLAELFSAVLREIFEAKRYIHQCKHCNKFFITPYRSDNKFCCRPSPENPNNSCAEQHKFEDRQIKERLATVARREYNVARARLERNATRDDEINWFYSEAAKFRESVLEREKSVDEYIAWLRSCGR